MSLTSCLQKQAELKKIFDSLPSPEAKYQKIIELGATLSPYPAEKRTPGHLVKGCQSVMYLHATLSENSLMVFCADSDALISRGLAALLLQIYNYEPPEVVLTCPPTVFQEIGLYSSLSPSRSNGLSSLFLTMKQQTLFLIQP